ncbi:MAG TPA: hypothetical protein VMS56_07605 [Thermoanaerobaculia bacterium]|nr:hypothetical protein [Thermoanaerobaculia bacterium]
MQNEESRKYPHHDSLIDEAFELVSILTVVLKGHCIPQTWTAAGVVNRAFSGFSILHSALFCILHFPSRLSAVLHAILGDLLRGASQTAASSGAVPAS